MAALESQDLSQKLQNLGLISFSQTTGVLDRRYQSADYSTLINLFLSKILI